MLRMLGTAACHEKLVMGRPSFLLSCCTRVGSPDHPIKPLVPNFGLKNKHPEIQNVPQLPSPWCREVTDCIPLRTQLTSWPLTPSHVLNSFVLCLAIQVHPRLLHLSSPCVFIDFHCHLSHLFSLPVHYARLSLPNCSFHLPPVPPIISSTCSLKQVPSALPWFPGFAFCLAPALPYGLGSPLQLLQAQTNPLDGPPCLPGSPGGVVMATRVQLPPDTTGGWSSLRGAESPTIPKATHPIRLPYPIPPLSFPPTCWPPSAVQWKGPVHSLLRGGAAWGGGVTSYPKGDTAGDGSQTWPHFLQNHPGPIM